MPCTCLARLRPDILLCVLGAPKDRQTPLMPTPSNTIQFIEFTYCHDEFPNTAHKEQIAKYNPLIHILRTTSWQINLLITITTGVRGAIREQPMKYLEKLKYTKMRSKHL